MELTTIIALVTSISSICGFFWIIYTTRKLNGKLSEYEPLINQIGSLFRYEEDDEGQPLLDVRVTKMIGALSSGIAKSFQMSVLGQKSGVARMEKGLKGAIAVDIAEEKIPMLGLIGDFMGINTKKYIEKHPDAMGQLFQLAQPYLQKFIPGQNDGGGRAPSRDGYM